MHRNIFMMSTFLVTTSFGFSLVEASSEDYKISEIPCTIERFAYNDKLYLHISLPDGLEIPKTYAYNIDKDEQAMICQFSAKVVDGTLFPDSDGYPLSNFHITVQANNNTETNTMTLVIKKVIQVVQKGFFVNTLKTSTLTEEYNYQQMQLNMASTPELSKLENDLRQGDMTFDIIFTH